MIRFEDHLDLHKEPMKASKFTCKCHSCQVTDKSNTIRDSILSLNNETTEKIELLELLK